MRIPFIGISYAMRSISFDAQRSVNIYPIKSEVEDSKAPYGLQGTPGLRTFIDFSLPTAGVRGSRQRNNRAFCVVGANLYEIFTDKTSQLIGVLKTDRGVVDMSDNGTQICLVDGPNGYIFNMNTGIFTNIDNDGWRGSYTVDYIDGYFLFADPETQLFYISSINDGTNEDALDFASAEGSPDNLLAVRAVNNEAWLFGTDSVEVFFDSGAFLFPFERVQGAFIKYGCVAKYSPVTTAKTVFWLGGDGDGSGIVFMAKAYQPQRISTFAIENAIQGYGTISDAVGYAYQEGGSYFYVLNFPSANTTWVYDINQNMWHERQYFNITTGLYERHRAQNHMFIFGKHLVGDYAKGIVYEQSLDILDDNGDVIRRFRTSPHEFDGQDLNYVYYDRFQVDMQVGTGLTAQVQEVIGTPWEISTAVATNESFDTSTQISEIFGMQLSSDGTKMYAGDFSNGKVFQYTLSIAGNLSTAVYSTKSLNAFAQLGADSLSGLAFNPGGTKLYILSFQDGHAYQYNLSTAWDLSTAVYASKTFDLSSQAANPVGIYMRADGLKFYVGDNSSNNTFQYSLSSAFDISTASYDSKSFDTSSQITYADGIFFKSDGKTFFNGDYNSGIFYEYTLSTAWDISTAVYAEKFLDASALTGATTQDIFITSDGNYLYVTNLAVNKVLRYDISTTVVLDDTDPQAILEWSDDGGYTWSNAHSRPIGKRGQYRSRAIWRRLGRARDRVFRLTINARCPVFIIDAYAEVVKGGN